MKIKNSQLDQEAVASLNELIEKDISAVVAFQLTGVVKELADIDKNKTAAEMKLIKKYANKDEAGNILPVKNEAGEDVANTFEIPNELISEFNQEMQDLLDFENDIDFEQIKVSDLKIGDNEKFSIKKAMKLDFLFIF